MNKTLLLILLAALAPFASAAETKTADKPKKAKAPAVKTIDTKASLHEKFAALDLNHDGALDASELAAYEKAVVETPDKDGKKPDEKQAAEARAALEKEFAREDAKHDGKVTEAEFASAEAPAAVPAK